ncbi:MAG: hypothetical protein CM15mP93_14900 [Thiotrichaceae bacterium]|nr:MAG: hypothetical protein CM15mP93_14900 [Thiotrichaceae bacterium]
MNGSLKEQVLSRDTFQAEKETSSFMGFKAAEDAIKSSNISKSDIDLIIVATTTPDHVFPSNACLIQQN